MTNITLSDGQTVDAERIHKVDFFPDSDAPRLLIRLDKEDGPIMRVQGKSALNDANNLDDIREEHHLNFGVFRHKPGSEE